MKISRAWRCGTLAEVDAQQAANPPVLILQAGPPGTDSLELHITPSYGDELVGLLNSHGLRHSRYLDFSLGSDLLAYGVGGLSALVVRAGLAQVLTAFFHKNANKRWTFKVGDDEFTAEGCSLEDAERWVAAAIEQKADLERRRSEVRAETERSGGAPPPGLAGNNHGGRGTSG